MSIYDNSLYQEDIRIAAELDYSWEKFRNKSIAISGGTGMIGSFLVDVIMYRNEHYDQNTAVYVIGRNRAKAEKRFGRYLDDPLFGFAVSDVSRSVEIAEDIEYVIHAASNTHPRAYSGDPIGTITANVTGTANLLEWASEHGCERFLFLSSVEIYGENRNDCHAFDESYCGYIDCNTMRAGYPESKRAGEALCQAYIRQKNMDIVIARLSRAYGPSMLSDDSKALSQFLLKGVNRENVVLKSEGTQEFSYAYVGDVVSALLYLILYGGCGEAYNIASDDSDIRLRDLAGIIADHAGTEVVFELPDEQEKAGYSKAAKALLNTEKIKGIGWRSLYDIDRGVRRTIDILRDR